MRILMVCLGNICRSPLAEGILQAKADELGLDWVIDSAGTGNWHRGEQPDRRSIQVARKYGIDISRQRARQFHQDDFEKFDLILAMDGSNKRDIERLAKTETDRIKVKLFLDILYEGENRGVPDPYYDDDGFEHVFKLIDLACEKLVQVYLQKET